MKKFDEIDIRKARYVIYGVYLLFGLLYASSIERPAMGFELYVAQHKMAQVWSEFRILEIYKIPYWSPELAAILIFLTAIPFLFLFGPCLLALSMCVLAWNLVGLRLIEKSFADERQGLFAVLLIMFGNPIVTEMHLHPSGGYLQILLPLGIVLYLTSYFLRSMETISRGKAFWLAFGAVAISAFMPVLAFTVTVISVVGLLAVPGEQRRRLFPPLFLGVAAGFCVFLPLSLGQLFPAARVFGPSRGFKHFGENFSWFLARDMANFLAIRGAEWWGYVPMAVVLVSIVAGFRSARLRTDPMGTIIVVLCVVSPLWILLYPHYRPGAVAPDIVRLRHLSVVWPYWAILLAMRATRKSDKPGWSLLGPLPTRTVALVMCAGGIFVSYAAINYGQIGISRNMPLENPIGRIIEGFVTDFTFPGRPSDIYRLPEDLRPQLAFMMPYRLMWEPNRGVARNVQNDLRQLARGHRPMYLEGLGFLACETSLPAAASVEKQLPQIRLGLPPHEIAILDRGCTMGHRWRDGEVYFRRIAWPLEDEMVETRSLRLLERMYTYRSTSGDRKRPRYPFSGNGDRR